MDKYREARTSLGGPRIMRGLYMYRWDDKEPVMGEGETKEKPI